MNSRKQVSNGMMILLWVIRPVVSFSSRRSWMEPPRGILDWCWRTDWRRGGQRTRTTLWGWHRRLVKSNRAKSRERIDEWVQWCLNETGHWSELVLVLKSAGCWVLGADWWNDLQVVMISIRVNWWAVIGWVGEPAVLCQRARTRNYCWRARFGEV